jgi:hypothetical protein
MQKPLEFAEIAVKNLHRNLAEIRHRKLNNHIRITQLTCGLPATPIIPIPRPHQTHPPKPRTRRKKRTAPPFLGENARNPNPSSILDATLFKSIF